MTCTRYPDDDLVLRYVTRDLTEPDQSAFEDHLFECDVCLARVERYQAAQLALASREVPSGPVAVSTGTAGSGRPGLSRHGWWLLAAAAGVMLAVAVGALVLGRTPPEPPPQLARRPAPAAPVAAGAATGRTSIGLQVAVLAMVTPPPYLPLTTRGEAEAARFSRGMDAYTRRAWTDAAEALREVDTPAARFYGGIADLMRGETADATTSLRTVRDSGVAPYARESAFYLGKAALQRGDVAQARTWFSAARDEGATAAREASRLLTVLADLEPR